MTQEFVPYQEALELKELEFDEPCLGLYHDDCMFSVSPCIAHEQYYRQVCMAPLYSQAFKWFRDKYSLQHNIVWNKFYPNNPHQWEVRKHWKDEPVIPYGHGGMSST